MSVWGKVIGGVGGFMLGGPLGALVGAAAGHAVDKEGGWSATVTKLRAQAQGLMGAAEALKTEAQAASRLGQTTRQQAFAVAVITLGAKMAKADGVVTRDEVNAFKRVFNIPDSEAKAVGAIFDQAKRSAEGYELYARQIAALFRGSPQVLEELLGALYVIASADGSLHPSEATFLHNVARLFNLPGDTVDRVRARFEGRSPDEPDPYAVLGISRDASDEEVRAAWTKLARQHHPDRLVSEGLPEEFIEQATQTMATINNAYDRIRESRGQKKK